MNLKLHTLFEPVVAALHRFLLLLIDLPRHPKRAILALNDGIIQAFALWVAVSVRYGQMFVPQSRTLFATLALAPLLGVLTLFGLDFYRNVTRFIAGRTINTVLIAMCLATLIWTFVLFVTDTKGVPRGALVVHVLLSTGMIWGSRQLAGWLLRRTLGASKHNPAFLRTPVIIYGAGPAAMALSRSLEWSDRYSVVGHVDRTPSLWGQFVGNSKVYRPERLPALIESRGVKEILVALDADVTRAERASVLFEIDRHGVKVRKLPDMIDLASGKITATDLKPVDAIDLLGRDAVRADNSLMRMGVSGKVIMVTGAGGSIGSELCRQLWALEPQRLILLDSSELALFEIHQQLDDRMTAMRKAAHKSSLPAPKIELVMVLGSVGDERFMRDVLRRNDVDTIYHAAAYKHVPIVESNPVKGIENNTFGTATLAQAARDSGVKRVVLVSTDKAVRPTNIMGASKRLAEMILQAHAAEQPSTIFTMVRFGNVLDSSGSVVKRFRQQIADGGPVTVTHPKMIRYFMLIPEAAALVIQAGTMAKGGEVFLLDMGEPVKIDALARSMINLAGYKVRDESQPNGDIAIEYVGLRPGEKLREELLIGSQAQPTDHPRIQTSTEPFLPRAALDAELTKLKAAMDSGLVEAMRECLKRTVEGYRLADSDSPEYAGANPAKRTWH
jgi:FlaA1/EpsC-like NDP-sugar epimerase